MDPVVQATCIQARRLDDFNPPPPPLPKHTQRGMWLAQASEQSGLTEASHT